MCQLLIITDMRSKKLGKRYKDGEVIIKQGESGNSLYVVQEGRVEVIHESQEGDVKIAELGISDFFGEMGLFEEDVRSCTVRAAGDATILTIDKRNFFKSIRRDPSLAYRLLEKCRTGCGKPTKGSTLPERQDQGRIKSKFE